MGLQRRIERKGEQGYGEGRRIEYMFDAHWERQGLRFLLLRAYPEKGTFNLTSATIRSCDWADITTRKLTDIMSRWSVEIRAGMAVAIVPSTL